MEDKVIKFYPNEIKRLEKRLLTIEEEREQDKRDKRNNQVEECLETLKKYRKTIKIFSISVSILFAVISPTSSVCASSSNEALPKLSIVCIIYSIENSLTSSNFF